MNLVITGAFGFLGSNITKELVNNSNFKIYAFVKSTTLCKRLSEEELSKITIIYIDEVSLDLFFKEHKIHGIIHTSTDYGRNSSISEIVNNNVIFPIKLIEKGKKNGLKFFVNYDSYFNKGNKKYKYLGNYILTKKHLEDWIKEVDEIKIFNLKLEHLYGENDSETKFVPFIINELFSNKEEIDLSEGVQERDFIYISDVVELTCELIEKHNILENKFYDIEVGTGKTESIKNFVLLVKSELKNVRSNLNFGKIPTRENEIMFSKADLSKLPQEIKWIPKVNLKEGLKKITSTLKK